VIPIGYYTDFNGELILNKPLDEKTRAYLDALYQGNIKEEGMPDSWCNWRPEGPDTLMAEDGKAYDPEAWLKYIIDKVLAPDGYLLNGEVYWYGEDPDDQGKIVVEDNIVRIFVAEKTYVER